MAYERGTVKFYDRRGQYGFAYVLDSSGVQTTEEVFFHLHDERPVVHGKDGTRVIKERTIRHQPNYSRLAEEGETIAFQRSAGQKGDKARPWWYADMWDKTVVYRVTMITEVGFIDPRVTASVIWEGSDTDKLSILHPPSDIFNADPLSPFREQIEDGWIRRRALFERRTHGGLWIECEDPRYRLTPVTELELEIEAENRRRFPGDYE